MADYASIYADRADGRRMHARVYAPANDAGKLPVVCLHGLTRNARDFETVAPAIAAMGRKVIVGEVRGRGMSDPGKDPLAYHPGTYADDVVRLLEAAGVTKAIFVGTSMGGIITMVLNAMKPDLVAAAVLNDVGPELDPVGLGRIMEYATEPPAPQKDWAAAAKAAKSRNEAAFPGRDAAFWEDFARKLFIETQAGPIIADYDPAIVEPLLNTDTGAAPADMWPLYEALATKPVLVVRGAISDLLNPTTAARMTQGRSDAALVEVAHVGHAPFMDEPEAAEAIGRFLSRLD